MNILAFHWFELSFKSSKSFYVNLGSITLTSKINREVVMIFKLIKQIKFKSFFGVLSVLVLPFAINGQVKAEPITVFVDDIIGFGNPYVDFFAMIFMMGFLYGVVWGGLRAGGNAVV